jgi:hypothetical protein
MRWGDSITKERTVGDEKKREIKRMRGGRKERRGGAAQGVY